MNPWDLALAFVVGCIGGLVAYGASVLTAARARKHRSFDRFSDDIEALLHECVNISIAKANVERALFKQLQEGPRHYASLIQRIQERAHFMPAAMLEHAKRLGLYAGPEPEQPAVGVPAAAPSAPDAPMTWVGAVKRKAS